MSRRDTDPDIMRLHVRDRLGDDGTPAMSERFLSRLDRCLADVSGGSTGPQRPGTPTVPLTLAEGLARLTQEYPALAAAVRRCCIEGQTLRAAARALGIDHCTVHKRRRQGVAQLVVWCGLPQEVVEAALGSVDSTSSDVNMHDTMEIVQIAP